MSFVLSTYVYVIAVVKWRTG